MTVSHGFYVCFKNFCKLHQKTGIKIGTSSDAKNNLSYYNFFFAFKALLQVLKFEFCQIMLGQNHGQLVINWQNFFQV